MKRAIITIIVFAGFALQALAYDFRSGNLLYTIISTDPPRVSLDGHVDGTAAQGELVIPETVDYEEITYTVTQIGQMAFAGCSGLTGHLTIPPTVETINAWAFRDCSGFTGDLVIPNSVTLLLGGSFMNCTGFDGHLKLPNSISKIYGSTFCGCIGLNGTLVIPGSVTEIAAQAFTSCGFTGTLVIPNSVTRISVDYGYTYEGYGSFQDCTGFTDLKLPNSIPIIGDYCFAQCTGLSGELVIPEGVVELWNHAFWLCSNLTAVKFPNSLTVIGYAAFKECEGLTGTLEIPLSVTKIYGYAFSCCHNINAINLHSDIQFGGNGFHVFDHCSSLAEITIPEGWERTGEYTFNDCSSLAKVTLPKSLKTIDGACFKGCINLSEINFQEGLTVIGIKAFSNCGLSGELNIPNSVERIEAFAFESCTSITRFVLGQSVNFVAEPAFRNTHLESMVIKAMTPPELKYIENQTNLPADLSVTVCCGTMEAYQSADGWREFTNIQEGITDLLSVISADETAGVACILKEAACEDRTVQVKALANEGCEFMYWEANGEMVSSDNPYCFELLEDTKVVAHFSGAGVNEMGHLFSVYPNPAQTELHLQCPPDVTPKQIELYDLQGRLVRTQGKDLESISMEGLPAGTYTMRVMLEDGKVFSDKVVKE